MESNQEGESQRILKISSRGIVSFKLLFFRLKVVQELKIMHFFYRYRKSFAQLLEEEQGNHPEPPNYVSALVEASQFPERHFCAVCGFPSNYTCLSCGARYCSCKCLGTHTDTR